MSTAAVTSGSGPAELTAWRGGSSEARRDRAFPMWVAAAAACHLLFLVGLYTAPPKILGDPSGSSDGVSVEIVTEAEATGRATVREEAAGAPAPAPMPPAPQQVATPSQPPAPEVAATPPPAAPSPPPVETAQQQAAVPPPAVEPKAPDIAPDVLKLDPTQPPAKAQEKQQERPPAKSTKPAEAKPAEPRPPEPKPRPKPEQQAKPQQNAKLDLSMPPAVMSAPGGGGAGVSRPPGHTRSGENDAFFRGVVRALQIAMPQLRDTVGMVTVRIILDMNGNLVRTEVMSPSGVPGLDQSVVFSTKQASFPFPPRNAVPADLEFRVRYLYNMRIDG